MKTVVFKIKGMHCTSCAIDIDGTLEDTNGVKEAITSYAKAETKITFDESVISPKKILSVVDKLGYTLSE